MGFRVSGFTLSALSIQWDPHKARGPLSCPACDPVNCDPMTPSLFAESPAKPPSWLDD